MFNLEYIAASLGVDISMGGLSVAEETQNIGGSGNTVTLNNKAVAFDGTIIGWYKLPSQGDDEWSVANITGNTMTIPGAQANTTYCVKYYYQNEDAKSIIIPTQYVPSELHVTIMNDLFSGTIGTQTDSTKYGRIITDIPRLQMDGNQDLSLTATGAATVSLTGSALAISSTDTCETEPYYGTMTEEIIGQTWQDNVIALAVENSDITLTTGQEETLVVRAVFGGSIASQRKDNSNFTFTVVAPGTSYANVGASTGTVTPVADGTAYVEVTLTGHSNVPPAYAEVTVTGM